MLVTYYFPYVSMLNAASVPSSVVDLIRSGHVHAAAANVQRLVDSHDDAPPAALLQLQGDLQLSLGMEVDADDSYREAQKRMRDDKDGMRFADEGPGPTDETYERVTRKIYAQPLGIAWSIRHCAT